MRNDTKVRLVGDAMFQADGRLEKDNNRRGDCLRRRTMMFVGADQ
jgi:hypothetical protein